MSLNKSNEELDKDKISISKFEIKDNEKIMTIKDIEFKTSQYLTNMLLNGNKYIIIDSNSVILILFFKAKFLISVIVNLFLT